MYSFLFVLGFALGANALLPAGKRDHDRFDAIDGRLPRNVVPVHYNLEVRPNINLDQPPFPYEGDVQIYIRCVEPTNTVVLNFKDLNFRNVGIVNDPNSPVPAPSPIFLSYTADSSTDFLTISFVNSLVTDATYIVTISFVGVLRDPTQRGIYYDYYLDRFGITHYLVATQLESIFARAMFPCFDEPDLKATFNTTIVRIPDHISLSNMDLLRSDTRVDGNIADVYNKSPIMSTYQVCVIIGHFQFVEADWEGVTSYPVRIYARPDMLPNLAFAAKVAPIIQKWFEDETGVAYHLPKMDHIALPSKSGAMENWGLITYSEFYLCLSPETSAITGELIVAQVIAHEIAHQWFGNIVTCKWWNDIWINEGFASHYEYRSLAAIGWPTGELEQIDGSQPFFVPDARNTSDPIIKNITNVWQAPSVFSGSTYPKGGAMLRHIRSILPTATFNAAITNFLNRFRFDSATSDDLWTVLTEQADADNVRAPDGSPLDFKVLMDPWFNQMGFPLLTVSNSGDGTAQVTSQRFFNPTDQSPDTPSYFNYQWHIPISVVTSDVNDWDSVLPTHWIPLDQTSTTIRGIPTDVNRWYLINPKQQAFYRVNYDDASRAAIVSQLLADHTVIATESRSQLLDDTFTLARVNVLPEVSAMELTRYLGSESSFNPWESALKHILYGDRILRNFLWHSNYRTYLLGKVAPIYSQLGWFYNSTESPLTRHLRRSLVTTACFFGDADCYENARLYYNYYEINPDVNSVDANNLPTVLCLGVSEGDGSDWSMVLNQYLQRKNTPFREERYAYLFALSCTADTAYLDMYLNYIVRGELISTRDQTQALRYMVQNNAGLALVWQYLDNSWLTVPSTISKFSILENIAGTFFQPADDSRFNNFVGKYPPQSD
jgi:aminopeptidase N